MLAVVDASVAVKWLVPEILSDKALALSLSWARSGTQPVAPYLMPAEVSNVLHRKVLRGALSPGAASHLLGGLLGSGIELKEPPNLHRRSIELARLLHQNTVYDTHYLALAEALGCELWTADERFVRASSPRFPIVRSLGAFSATP